VAGAIASLVGFGVGSVLTPVFALGTTTKLAVAAVAIPHFIGSAARLATLRRHVEWRVFKSFGIASAAGGLAGAILHARISSRAMAVVFGALLILAALSEWTHWIDRIRWGRGTGIVAGALSGMFGGLVGNQGGIRSAAMLAYDVPKASFVATATAAGLCVDLARMPVYLAIEGPALAPLAGWIVAASLGVLIGTALGVPLLHRIPERLFRKVVAALLLGLGVYMIAAGAP
jgi:hypothetical protein